MANKDLYSYLSGLKKQAFTDANYGGNIEENGATINVTACPSCGASRAKEDGLVCCAYCGYKFLSQRPTDGIYVKKEDG